MTDLGPLFRKMKVAETRRPPSRIEQDERVARALAPGDLLDPRLVKPYLPLVGEGWGESNLDEWKRIRQPGTLVLFAVRVDTAPGPGGASIAFLKETEITGVETIIILSLEEGQRFGIVEPLVGVSAGTWLAVDILDDGGAINFNLSYSMRVV